MIINPNSLTFKFCEEKPNVRAFYEGKELNLIYGYNRHVFDFGEYVIKVDNPEERWGFQNKMEWNNYDIISQLFPQYLKYFVKPEQFIEYKNDVCVIIQKKIKVVYGYQNRYRLEKLFKRIMDKIEIIGTDGVQWGFDDNRPVIYDYAL